MAIPPLLSKIVSTLMFYLFDLQRISKEIYI